MPNGFTIVDNSWAGIADKSLEGMVGIIEEADNAMGGMVEDTVANPVEELPLSTLTYHISIMSYLGHSRQIVSKTQVSVS